MASPKRSSVYMESFLINAIGIGWSKIGNRNIRLQMNILAEMLQEELNKKQGKKQVRTNNSLDDNNDKSESENIKFFIAYFNQRYVQETDIEYKVKISSKEIALIKCLLKKLKDKSVSIEEYLSWIFDDFFDDERNRSTFVPMISFVCGTFVATKFFMQNQPKIRKQKAAEAKQSRKDLIRDRAKVLYRKTKDQKIQKRMELERDGTITLNDLEKFLAKYELEQEG